MGKILIIDDDEASRIILTERLNNEKDTCIVCNSGEEAISLLDSIEFSIDLVFLDIRLPEIDGWETLKQIKKINANIPVIAISAIAISENLYKYNQAGFDGFISKPFNNFKIQEIVNFYLKK